LENWLKAKKKVELKDIIVILDNAMIHKSKIVLNHFREVGWEVFFLPAYTPELAPVEHFFSKLKRSANKVPKNK
jgi:transposase